MMRFVRLAMLLLAGLALGPLGADAEEPVRKVLMIGIDGLRTDALKAAKTPALDRLIREGAFAQKTMVVADRPTGADTVSGPSWSSLLTGVWADKHGVTDNKFEGENYEEYPHVFTRLKEVRPEAVTVSLVTWAPIGQRIVSGADVSVIIPSEQETYGENDRRLAEEAVRLIEDRDPDFVFVYFGNVDETGHARGFHPLVPQYRGAIEEVDRLVGRVTDVVRARSTEQNEDWLTIVCTDHGGRGTKHSDGHDVPEIREVFLIVSGASAARGEIEGPTALVDAPATALVHLGIGLDPAWKLDGRAVGLKQVPPAQP